MRIEPKNDARPFALFDAKVSPASDIDLYVYFDSRWMMGQSVSPTSTETVSLNDPPPGVYTVWLHGWDVPAAAANFTLFRWLLGSTDQGNMSVVAPSAAVVGPGTIALSFTGLEPGTKYLGSVAYGIAGVPPTMVRVDP